MAAMCFDAAGKPLKIKWAPKWLFGILANLPKIKKAGKHDIILFSKWTLSHNLVGDTEVGEGSFKKYLNRKRVEKAAELIKDGENVCKTEKNRDKITHKQTPQQ